METNTGPYFQSDLSETVTVYSIFDILYQIMFLNDFLKNLLTK